MSAQTAAFQQVEEQLAWLPGTTTFPALANVPRLEKTYWRGMAIYTYEDAATHLYFILKGRVKVMRSSPAGQQKITALRYCGEVFGDLALAGKEVEARRSDSAVALDTTRVALLRVSDFWHAVKNDSPALQRALQYLTARLAEAQQQISALVFEPNQQRLAQALLELAAAALRVGEPSVRLTHEELAELIGSTREVVTGMMIEFRQRGLIDYKRGEVRPHLARLKQFLREENFA